MLHIVFNMQIFDDKNSIKNLEKFTSLNGSKHYAVNTNNTKIKLVKNKIQ